MRNNKHLVSSMPPLIPYAIWDAKTGESVSPKKLEKDTEAICSFVQTEAQRIFNQDKTQVTEDALNLKGSANSYGRQKGYKSNYKNLSREILSKSRINELVLHKLMSETASYARSIESKKELSFPKTINLGAVDKNMASLSKDGATLTLFWRCWSGEYLIEFAIPSYILKRSILKFSLPVVRYSHKGYEFIFTTQETIPVLPINTAKAGLDLGRVEPYTLAVVNTKRKRIAHYTSSKRLKELNSKRDSILAHKKNILAKIDQYKELDLNTERLLTEKDRLTSKATILGKVIAQNMGSEIAKKLHKHHLNILNVENLTWVKGRIYGSRWNHSHQQQTISHALLREGTRVKKVSPKNSSKLCHSCGAVLTHSLRKVRCLDCQSSLDRDFNAAMNIATQNHLIKRYPNLMNRLVGDNFSSTTEQVINFTGCSSMGELAT